MEIQDCMGTEGAAFSTPQLDPVASYQVENVSPGHKCHCLLTIISG